MRDPKRHTPAAPPSPSRSRTRPGAEKGTISIQFVRSVVEAVKARGLEPDPLLRASGISPELLEVPRARVSPAHYSALWRLVIERLDDEFFGQDSRRMKTGSFALLVRSVVHCTTLRAALDRTSRFFTVFLDDVGVAIEEGGAEARIALRQRNPRASTKVFAHETLLVMSYGLACWLVGRRIPVLEADFAYPTPLHVAEYPALFSDVMRFDQPETRLIIDAGVLDLPVIQNERTAKDFLRVAPESILLRYKNTLGLSARLRRRLRQALPNDFPELDAMARELGTAPATLRRRLKAEGESYQSIKDEVRRDLAITYLSTTDLSIRDIALELGFLEPSAFHRAFRKWAHTSPGAYRRADLGAGASDAAASPDPRRR